MTSRTDRSDFGRGRQREIFVRGVAGRRPLVPVAPEALARRAREVMTPEAWAYVAGGAGVESTIDANRRAFERWRIVPRVLRDVSRRDLSIELFGERLPAPLLLAPIGVLEMAHREADRAVARAAAAAGMPMIFSSQASVSMEECARAMDAVAAAADGDPGVSGADGAPRTDGPARGGAPRWFQLYWSTSDALVESFVARAEACGCGAIVLTLDTTMLGWRPRDLDLAHLPFLRGMGIAQYTSDPVFRQALAEEGSGEGGDEAAAPAPRPPLAAATVATAFAQMRRYPGSWRERLGGDARRAVARFVATYSRPSLAWEDLPRLRRLTRLPILLKGVLHPDDARRAVDAGMDGVVVSNHGGRQVDGALGALDALPGVVEAIEAATAGGRSFPVLLDSGVRTGADVVKALALGATAVCLGRPYVYGLALAGERGVTQVIDDLLAELDLTLGLAGCRSVAELGPDVLRSAKA